ncbi:MAG TPA: PQQ-binding-like beta-propeller repeat protein [Actinomycetota bacterium]|jgi:outer membrane protein assembly factor BamB|nr:PQQ-binding-like beta-propeller repeat protein [Actinomycetota bacterium]
MAGRHASRSRVRLVAFAALFVAVCAAGAWWTVSRGEDRGSGHRRPSPTAHASSPDVSPTDPPSPPSPTPSPDPGPINTKFRGLTTFRGNATRSYYGEGPVPSHPIVRWRYPSSGGLCSTSSDNFGTRVWCGIGWTGQPNVIRLPDGTIEVREGAYDAHYHFLNGKTGEPLRPDLVTGDLAKGSATSDAQGFPLYYAGSRDNLLRVVALDRDEPTVLWSFDARSQPGLVWNDDWDGAPLQLGDYLLEGGENSWFYVFRLHRHYDDDGLVQVNPKIVMRVPGWDQGLLDAIGDTDISIESSVAFVDGVAYFANSGGLVQGWDISDILDGGTKYRRVFRFWNGDSTDATVVIDPDGYLYVGRKMEANVPRPASLPRDHEIGSLMKLDPSRPKDPLVWSVQLGGFDPGDGLLGTPAWYRGIVYATYTEGGVAAVDAETGKLLWDELLPGPTWSSPVPVDKRLIVADGAGDLSCFDISKPRRRPKLVWRLHVGGTIESTPAVWHGWIYVGSRDGGIYGIANAHTK